VWTVLVGLPRPMALADRELGLAFAIPPLAPLLD
jgi:hypothetical protein